MTNDPGMTYKESGVDYDAMDPFKRLAQVTASETNSNIDRFGIKVGQWSRGESAFLMDLPALPEGAVLGHVEEGLGTKNLVADAMHRLTDKSYYDAIAQDTVAMIVNDLITLGLLPLSVAQHLAVGSSDWFLDEQRCLDLVNGWKHACNLARCVWGPGETPTLKDMIDPNTAVLAGSAVGFARSKDALFHPAKIQDGDAIVFLGASGIHANGLTMARKIAAKLPAGYLTKLSDGRTFGEALLDPTPIYVGFVEDCLLAGVDIHYAVNITGHGWRKLMRAPSDFAYIIERIPKPMPIFDFIQQHGPVSDYEAYGNLNMGAGFALYVRSSDVMKMLDLYTHRAEGHKYPFPWLQKAGHIKAGAKKVHIVPKNIVYTGSTLAVR